MKPTQKHRSPYQKSALGLVSYHSNGGASASPPFPLVASSTASDPKLHLLREIRGHEIAIGELGNLPASRNVYQKNGNLFFRTTIQKATSSEQKQLNSAKAQLQKLNSP